MLTREFVITHEFDKNWKAMGLTDKDLRSLQEELILNPSKGDLMQGTGGLRKLRIALEGRGKSGKRRIYLTHGCRGNRYFINNAWRR